MDTYGSLEVVRADINGILVRDCVDPLRRIVGLQRHRSLVPVDLATGEELESFKEPFRVGVDATRIAPDGKRLVQRQAKKLVIRERKSTIAEAKAPGVVHFGYTADGKHIWAATETSIDLYDAELEQVDSVPVEDWTSESTMAVEPAAPEWVLGIGNCGDSFGGAVAFTVKRGKLVVDPKELTKSLGSIVVEERTRRASLTATPDLLIVDNDGRLRIATWPPPTVRGREKGHIYLAPTDPLRDDAADGFPILPWLTHDPKFPLEIAGNVSASAEHILVGLEQKWTTAGILALDPKTFETRGIVRSPTAGTDVSLELYSGDRFAATAVKETTIWRLSR